MTETIQRAGALYERLAQASPDAHLPELAASLHNLSKWLGVAGRRAEALAAIKRALAIRERLAQASPDAYLPDLAMSLTMMAGYLVEARRRADTRDWGSRPGPHRRRAVLARGHVL